MHVCCVSHVNECSCCWPPARSKLQISWFESQLCSKLIGSIQGQVVAVCVGSRRCYRHQNKQEADSSLDAAEESLSVYFLTHKVFFCVQSHGSERNVLHLIWLGVQICVNLLSKPE